MSGWYQNEEKVTCRFECSNISRVESSAKYNIKGKQGDAQWITDIVVKNK